MGLQLGLHCPHTSCVGAELLGVSWMVVQWFSGAALLGVRWCSGFQGLCCWASGGAVAGSMSGLGLKRRCSRGGARRCAGFEVVWWFWGGAVLSG